MPERRWSEVEYLSSTVTNPNIIVKGTHSYYSNAWTENFESSVVRYLYGDEHSRKNWQPQWELDKLYIGNFVCIGAEAVILMGGNNTHRMDWISDYPFPGHIKESYRQRGDTVIGDGAWIGMRAMIMPGVKIGEGAVVAAGSIVTKDVPPYTVVAGNPAQTVRRRFAEEQIERLLNLHLYELPEEQIEQLENLLCSSDLNALEKAVNSLRNA